MNVQRRKEGKKTHEFNALADAMELLSACEGAIFCPGWEMSVGCRAERAFCMQQGIGIHFYEPKKLKDARTLLMANLEKHRPEKPVEGAVKLTTEWAFHCGKTHKKDFWKTTRPDTDNLVKLLKDCMTASGFWKDDAQVVWEITKKFYGEFEGIYVRMEELK